MAPSRLFGSAGVLTSVAFARAGVGLALAVLSIKALGAEAFGRFAFVAALGSAFQVSYSGIYLVVVARLVNARANVGIEGLRSAGAIARAALVVTIPAVALLWAISGLALAWRPMPIDYRTAILGCAAMYSLQLVTTMVAAVIEGTGRVVTASVLSMAGVTLLTVGLVSAQVQQQPVTLGQYVGAGTLFYGLECVLIVGALVGSSARSLLLLGRARMTDALSLLREGMSIQVAKLLGFLMEPANKAILLALLGPAYVAVYDLVAKMASGLHSIFGSYCRLFLQIPQCDHAGRRHAVRQAAEHSWVLFLLVAAGVAAVVIWPVSRWVHVDTYQLAMGFAITSLTNWLMIVATPLFLSLVSFGEHRFLLRNQCILAVTSIAGSAAMVPLLGLPGAFLGALAATALNVALIERRFLHYVPDGERGAVIARGMAGRLALAVLALFAVPVLVAEVHDIGLLVVACAACLTLVVTLLLQEPAVHWMAAMLRGRVLRAR